MLIEKVNKTESIKWDTVEEFATTVFNEKLTTMKHQTFKNL